LTARRGNWYISDSGQESLQGLLKSRISVILEVDIRYDDLRLEASPVRRVETLITRWNHRLIENHSGV
jgi:hypothetical protein